VSVIALSASANGSMEPVKQVKQTFLHFDTSYSKTKPEFTSEGKIKNKKKYSPTIT